MGLPVGKRFKTAQKATRNQIIVFSESSRHSHTSANLSCDHGLHVRNPVFGRGVAAGLGTTHKFLLESVVLVRLAQSDQFSFIQDPDSDSDLDSDSVYFWSNLINTPWPWPVTVTSGPTRNGQLPQPLKNVNVEENTLSILNHTVWHVWGYRYLPAYIHRYLLWQRKTSSYRGWVETLRGFSSPGSQT